MTESMQEVEHAVGFMKEGFTNQTLKCTQDVNWRKIFYRKKVSVSEMTEAAGGSLGLGNGKQFSWTTAYSQVCPKWCHGKQAGKVCV